MDKMPVFVKVDDYNDVLKIVEDIKSKIVEAKSTLSKVNELKTEEDHQLEMWLTNITEIEKKIEFIDSSLNEPEDY